MSSTFPWMLVPGNHEADCNYTYINYRSRFAAQNFTQSKINSKSSRWYSFDKGPVHFIAIDTDAYGFDEVAYILQQQYEWLESDLQSVNTTETPWIVLMGHRPMYCSSSSAVTTSHLGWPKQLDNMTKDTMAPMGYGDGFRSQGVHPPNWHQLDVEETETIDTFGTPSSSYPCGVADLLRNGMKTTNGTGRIYGLETLMEKYNIDVYLTGHEHNYERTYPIMNGTIVKSYDAPGKPVHVVTGAGGAYGKDPFFPVEAEFDAYRSSEWCYSDIYVNRSHFILEQKLATNSTVIDRFVLIH